MSNRLKMPKRLGKTGNSPHPGPKEKFQPLNVVLTALLDACVQAGITGQVNIVTAPGIPRKMNGADIPGDKWSIIVMPVSDEDAIALLQNELNQQSDELVARIQSIDNQQNMTSSQLVSALKDTSNAY